ncbi:MAG: hypothetical protein ACYTJ0_17875, partial [Planctomycetota bacterium]
HVETPGIYEFPIYAGAGQCDLDKGTLVGHLHVDSSSVVLVEVTYVMDPGFAMDEVHIYIGDEILPRKNGEFTVAPGQYQQIEESLVGDFTTAYAWQVDWDLDGFYVVAHAVVCSTDD